VSVATGDGCMKGILDYDGTYTNREGCPLCTRKYLGLMPGLVGVTATQQVGRPTWSDYYYAKGCAPPVDDDGSPEKCTVAATDTLANCHGFPFTDTTPTAYTEATPISECSDDCGSKCPLLLSSDPVYDPPGGVDGISCFAGVASEGISTPVEKAKLKCLQECSQYSTCKYYADNGYADNSDGQLYAPPSPPARMRTRAPARAGAARRSPPRRSAAAASPAWG